MLLKEDKLLKFTYFDGKKNPNALLAWLRTFESYFDGKIIPNKNQIRFGILHFIGETNVWWEAQNVQNLTPNTWDEFKLALPSYFIPQGYEDEIRIKWDKLRQYK